LTRHNRGDPPQRGLLVREPVDLGPGLGVRNGACDQVAEVREAGLGVGGKRLSPTLRSDHHAPQASLHRNRTPVRRTDAELPHARPKSAGCRGVVVDARRPAGACDECCDVLAVHG
jgi:hypothetical protein